MELSKEQMKKLSKWLIGIIAVCTVIYLGVQHIDVVAGTLFWAAKLISPLLIGFFFALILNVPLRFFETHLWKRSDKPILQKLRRPVSFLISLAVILSVIVGVVRLVIPELVNAITIISQSILGLLRDLSVMDPTKLAELPFGKALLSIDWDGLLASLQTWLKNQSGTIVNTAFGTIGSIVGGVFNFFIAFIFAIYVLFGKEKLKRQASRLIHVWLPESFGSWFLHAASIANSNFQNFVSGQTLEAGILGFLCMIGMLLLRLPYAPMVGALVGVTALIPVVGSWIGAIVGAFMIFTVSPMKAVGFLVFLLVLQQIEGNVIYPRVMGSRVNLPGMWILVAVTIAGGIAGPIGVLLAVPLSSTIYVLVREATETRELQSRLDTPGEKLSEN
ncbi:MAG: AI-2E family transporter [Acutalibacter sp.]|jgi:predicted PurR-regulated permease PerM